MIQILFKNLKKSELIQEIVRDRIKAVVEKFVDLRKSKIQVTLDMQNSPTQPGPDLFNVKLFVRGGRYNGISVEKPDRNLYAALADVVDHMLEVLNRHGDKVRVKQRKKARDLVRSFKTPIDDSEFGEAS